MNKKELLTALQMKCDGISTSRFITDYHHGYGKAVKDLANLMGENIDDYGIDD